MGLEVAGANHISLFEPGCEPPIALLCNRHKRRHKRRTCLRLHALLDFSARGIVDSYCVSPWGKAVLRAPGRNEEPNPAPIESYRQATHFRLWTNDVLPKECHALPRVPQGCVLRRIERFSLTLFSTQANPQAPRVVVSTGPIY